MEPKIRLKGFSEEWKSDVIGNIATFSKGRGYSKSDLTPEGNPIILYGRLYTKYSSIIDSVDTYAPLKSDSVLSKGNEVIIPGSGETAEDIAVASSVEQKGVIIGGDLNIVTFDSDKIVPAFAAMSITNSITHYELSGYAQGKTIVHIHNDSISKGHLSYPSKDEQVAIVSYISSLDSLIQSTAKMIESLKQVKAASLQSMFPQEGETIPLIRFKGFEEEWKTIPVGKLGVWTKGRLLSKSDMVVDGKTPCIHYGELFVNYGAVINAVISKTNIDNGCYSKRGDILFPDSDVTPTGLARCSAIMVDDVLLGGGINILKVNKKYYSPFISYSINQEKGQIISRVTGTTVRHINSSALSEVLIKMPADIREQEKLADYFTIIDTRIILQTQRLEKLKQIKSACLDNMFV